MDNCPNIKQLLLDFPLLLSSIQITDDCKLHGIGSLESLKKNDILFCPSIEQINQAVKKNAKLVIIPSSISKNLEIKDYKNLNILKSPSLQESMAKIGQKYFSINNTNFSYNKNINIHPTAIVDSSAKIHSSVKVGAYSVIEAGVQIDEKVFIGSHSVISKNSHIKTLTEIGSHNFIGNFVKIGKANKIGQQVCIEHTCEIYNNNNIHSKVFIGRGSVINNDCEIESHTTIGSDGFGYGSSADGKHYKKVHFGNVIIKDNVQIGSSVSIDRGTFGNSVVGEGTKIDNLCHIAHNVKIGRHCLITAGFACAGSTTIGNSCVFGGQVAVGGHINICDNVQIVARSVITNNVLKPGTYGGFPLQEVKKFRRTQVSLSKVPDLITKINKLTSKN
ncbi:MAG: UDP-3-O-(3-hydroxymyristoyl)glucosamine N-acyltransferase [Bdellovibrionales bacterium]|nr:UDP-3-O-(3-hydroxymyristoyl)glucosamine N-acyltransferase [Bdellovibrionales bacterium]